MSRLGFLRLPATISLIGVLLTVALVTETVTSALTAEWLLRTGFAPIDLWELDLFRVLSSALVTRGSGTLVVALFMTALCVGLVERTAGWRAAILVFWGVHILTLALMGLALGPVQSDLQSSTLASLGAARGVGPSAGYLGSLGFGLSVAGGRLRLIGAAAVVLWLGLDALGVIRASVPIPQELSADIAHLIAFPSGWIVGLLHSNRRG